MERAVRGVGWLISFCGTMCGSCKRGASGRIYLGCLELEVLVVAVRTRAGWDRRRNSYRFLVRVSLSLEALAADLQLRT